MTGIYKITNKITGKSYVGQSIRIKERWRQHKYKGGSSDNPMYLDFKKYGLDNFSFEVLEECNEEYLNEREIYWIKHFNTFNDGYNLTPGGNCGSYKNLTEITVYKKLNDMDCFALDLQDYTMAAAKLSPAGLKLYMFLARNKNNALLYLNSKDFCSSFGVADRTYRDAKAQLLKCGYIKEEKGSNKLIFNTAPVFKETQDSLKEKLKNLFEILKRENSDMYDKLIIEMDKVNFKEIEDEDKRKMELKRLIDLAEGMVNSIADCEFEKFF